VVVKSAGVRGGGFRQAGSVCGCHGGVAELGDVGSALVGVPGFPPAGVGDGGGDGASMFEGEDDGPTSGPAAAVDEGAVGVVVVAVAVTGFAVAGE
jgi:hypothetical protein